MQLHSTVKQIIKMCNLIYVEKIMFNLANYEKLYWNHLRQFSFHKNERNKRNERMKGRK